MIECLIAAVSHAPDDFIFRLEQLPESGADHSMVIREQNAGTFHAAPLRFATASSWPVSADTLSSEATTGTVATILVPVPCPDSMTNRPCIRFILLCMLTSPSGSASALRRRSQRRCHRLRVEPHS